MPSEVDGKRSWFDRFATRVSELSSRAVFFALCVALVVVWAPTGFLFGFNDTWQLLINTPTTIITFLLVALLQNTQKRSDDAMQQKLNAIAAGLAELMNEHYDPRVRAAARELGEAVGLEEREGA